MLPMRSETDLPPVLPDPLCKGQSATVRGYTCTCPLALLAPPLTSSRSLSCVDFMLLGVLSLPADESTKASSYPNKENWERLPREPVFRPMSDILFDQPQDEISKFDCMNLTVIWKIKSPKVKWRYKMSVEADKHEPVLPRHMTALQDLTNQELPIAVTWYNWTTKRFGRSNTVVTVFSIHTCRHSALPGMQVSAISNSDETCGDHSSRYIL